MLNTLSSLYTHPRIRLGPFIYILQAHREFRVGGLGWEIKANGCFAQLFLSDSGTEFSKSIGWTMGERTARYAIVIDHGKVIYAEKEPGREVSVS